VPADPVFPCAGSKDFTTLYGPLFTVLTLPLAKTSIPVAFWTLKAVAALASLGVVALVWWCAQGLGRDPRLPALAVGLNPLVLTFTALLVILAVWRWAPGRRALLRVSVLPLVGVLLQAVLGGITVLTGLNPAIVAGHFLASMVLVSLSAYLLYRVGEGDAAPVSLVRPEIRAVAWVTAALGALILALGTVVTGAGPHSGDATTPRFAFDPRTVSWLHADAVMLFLGLVGAVLLAVHLTARESRPRRAWCVVLALTLLQGLVGYTQYLTGLPEVLVLVHMLGASLLVASLTYGVLSLRRR